MQRQKKTMEELDRVSGAEYKKLKKKPLLVVLDNVRSAHNVGSVFRTCDAFLIEKIYLCGITPVPPNPEIHKTALGATESVEWEYAENADLLIQDLKASGHLMYSVEQTHKSIPLSETPVFKTNKCVLVFGHEVYGVSQSIVNQSDICIEIPQSGTKHSLNISVCAGIVLYHFFSEYSV